jgi:hypothetical protein
LRLILVLPDGSRCLVPDDWTDLPGRQAVAAGEPSTQAALLGTVADLLQAHTLVDALLRRLSLSREESQRAAEPELQTPPRPEAAVWERLDDQQRQVVVNRLARLLVKAVLASARRERGDE